MPSKKTPYITAAAIFLVLLATAILIFKHRSIIATENRILNSIPNVTAQFETFPVSQGVPDDAADDPAIWINFANPDSS
ncbi:MAG TPA: hypothetical protein DDW27_01050 [Bacteroidales bacterium]|nr:hypothetical protein [Bacteroidales bacterium]